MRKKRSLGGAHLPEGCKKTSRKETVAGAALLFGMEMKW